MIEYKHIHYRLSPTISLEGGASGACLICGEQTELEMNDGEFYCEADYRAVVQRILNGEMTPNTRIRHFLTEDQRHEYNNKYNQKEKGAFDCQPGSDICPCPVCGQYIQRKDGCNHMTHAHYHIEEDGTLHKTLTVDFCIKCCERITLVDMRWRDFDDPDKHHFIRDDVFDACFNSLPKGENDVRKFVNDVRNNPLILRDAPIEYRSNPEIVRIAVNRIGSLLQYASEELKNDKNIVLAAIRSDGNAFQYASDELKDDENFVFGLVKDDVRVPFKYASHRLRTNEKFVLKCVKYSPFAINEFKNDREVVLKAIEIQPDVFEWLSKTLKSDKEVVLLALRQIKEFKHRNGFSVSRVRVLSNISPDLLRKDNKLVLRILLDFDYVEVLMHASETFFKRESGEFPFWFKHAIDVSRGQAFAYFPYKLRNDIEVVKYVLKINANMYKYISYELQHSKEILRLAISHATKFWGKEHKYLIGADIICRASSDLKLDKEFIQYTVQNGCDLVILELHKNPQLIFDVAKFQIDDIPPWDKTQSLLLHLKPWTDDLTWIFNNNHFLLHYLIINPGEILHVIDTVKDDFRFMQSFLKETNLHENPELIYDIANSIVGVIPPWEKGQSLLLQLRPWSQSLPWIFQSQTFLKPYLVLNPSEFLHIDNDMKEDLEFNIAVVRLNGMLLEYINDEFRSNISVINKALQNNLDAFRFVPEALRSYPAIVKTPEDWTLVQHKNKQKPRF